MEQQQYGSDAIVQALAQLGITHVGLNPGATTRGLHDSLIRQQDVASVLALDERVAVAMAQGYAKATGRPMAVALHNLVGLLSGSIGVFNSFVDRMPMIVIGGSGPASKLRRRPWIDWIHAVRSQGNAVRDFVKWADEPVDLEDTLDSLVRAYEVAMTPPMGPVYIGIDTEIQEALLEAPLESFSLPRAPVTIKLGGPRREHLEAVTTRLAASQNAVLLTDYVGRSERGFRALIDLAERAGIAVVDLGASHNFPSTHWANATLRKNEALAAADLVLAVDVRNTSFALSKSDPRTRTSTAIVSPSAHIVEVGEGPLLDRTFIDLGQRFPVDELVVADPVEFVEALAERAADTPAAAQRGAALRDAAPPAAATPVADEEPDGLSPATILATTHASVRDVPWVVANSGIRGGYKRDWPMEEFADHLGRSGGGGLGYGVGAALGVAAAVDPGTVVVDLQPDGDLFYTSSGLWTAAHHDIPVLFVVLNNRTYGQDLMHQRQVAKTRERDVPGLYPGIDITEPDIDIPGLARAFGVEAFDTVRTQAGLAAVLEQAVAIVREGRPCLVDVAYDG